MPFISEPQSFSFFRSPAPPQPTADVPEPRLEAGIPPAAWPGPDDPCWEIVGVERSELVKLYGTIQGYLLFPGLHSYSKARAAAEAHYPTPRVIAFCAIEEDVAVCLNWAIERKWLFSVRSGGHNTAGFHLCNGLVIDVHNLNNIDYNSEARQVTVGTGVTWGALGNYLLKNTKDAFVPGGTCAHVSVSGYTMGGGYSMVSRTFGLTCDLLISARVMLWNGEIVLAAADNEFIDLFKALRGGGGGQFGILLSLTFAVPEGPDDFFGFVLNWNLDHAAAALAYIEEHHTSNETSTQLGYLIALTALVKENEDPNQPREAEKQASLSMLGMFRGDERQARAHLKGLLDVAPHSFRWRRQDRYQELTGEIFKVLPYFVLGLNVAKRIETGGLVAQDSEPVDWERIVQLSRATPHLGNLIGFEPYGGAIAHKVPHTAFPHRHNKLNTKFNSYWTPEEGPWPRVNRIDAQRWLEAIGEAAAPSLTGHKYINYMSEELVDFRRAYWGHLLDELLEVKEKYDPHNIFRFEQSIRRYK